MNEGILVQPQNRINLDQIKSLHKASLALLNDPGITCYNEHAAELFSQAGCKVTPEKIRMDQAWRISFPEQVVMETIETAPQQVRLGARNPDHTLVLEADTPRAYFGTGSETNIYLKTTLDEYVKKDDNERKIAVPGFTKERGSISFLCESAKLCNSLPNVDFFIRNVNIQDEEITLDNKDVNVFFAALLYMTKHVQAGIVNLDRLDEVLKMAEIIAGGPEQLKRNPIISFITCLIKSPLQMVMDTTDKLIAIAQKGIPVVISSSPQGGSTSPIEEEGLVALINAEILAGISLAQIVNPGTPVMYGAVPIRTRMDNLHDLYGAPEFIHYNINCIQMARHYGIPCYSSAGVGDAKTPGLQSTIEKLFSQYTIAAAGAQYIHYAFGLLDKTNVFCPLQAVLDDAHMGLIQQILRQPVFDEKNVENAIAQIRHTVNSDTKLFARHIRKAIGRGLVSMPYPFESDNGEDQVLVKAYHRLQEIINGEDEKLDEDTIGHIYDEITGLLPLNYFELKD